MLHLGLQLIINCSNDYYRVDLDQFYGKVKSRNSGFSIGKSENSGFLETIAACDLNISRCKQLDKKIKVYEYSRSRSFLDFGLM